MTVPVLKPLLPRHFNRSADKIYSHEKIARLGYGLTANHAFIDGNKRIGAMLVQLLLKWNGYQLKLKTGELAAMFIAVADGSANEAILLHWIQTHLNTN